jgi:hypothetical protein
MNMTMIIFSCEEGEQAGFHFCFRCILTAEVIVDVRICI